MGKAKITSDGTARGTTFTVDGYDITHVISRIEFDSIEPAGTVDVRVDFMCVDLEAYANANIEMMDVVVDGELTKRPVEETDSYTITQAGCEDREEMGVKRPVTKHGECVSYFLDGRPPVITQALED